MQQLMTIPVIAFLILSPSVLAQSATETGTDLGTTATTNGFDELSPGSKMIARSLMDAQTLPADGTTQPWSLDDIAAARSETGWGNVFKHMQAEGLIEAKNLGEVVSAHAIATHRPITEGAALEAGIPPDSGVNEEFSGGDMAGETTASETPADIDGSFESLSTGNKKIVRSLMDAQTLPGDSSVEPWTLDRIAAAKNETGWGNVFQQMQAEGLIDAKNLGQVVSQYQLHNLPTTPAADAAISTAAVAGSTSADRLPEQAHDNAAGQADKGLVTAVGGNSNNAGGITTAAGSASGNAYGLNRHSVSAAGDITAASGTAIGGNAAANSAGVSAVSNSSNAAVTAGTSAVSNSTAGTNNGQGFAYGRSR
ncbi:MAG: hypothetical protein U5P41_06280 [Gammaproteobacteria bacterium]|nr:hypothetical protein [Gammaproteobacteria bacterium]